ncbi:MAG: hypothetical protein Q8L23_09920 [Caulobacter sp.]|nr:hypothetical protein [Caulobacter sp.]
MSVRFQIAALIYMMVQGVLFGIGVVAILVSPPLAERAAILIPALVLATGAISLPISWFIAPRLRLRGRRNVAGI